MVNTNSQLVKVQRIKSCGVLSHKQGHPSHPFPRAKATSLKRGQKDYKSLRQGRTRDKKCFLDMMGPPHFKLSASVVACTRSTEDQTGHYSSVEDRGRGLDAPPTTEDLGTVDSFWGSKSQFSLRVWLLAVDQTPVVGPGANGLHFLKDTKSGVRSAGVDLEGVLRE